MRILPSSHRGILVLAIFLTGLYSGCSSRVPFSKALMKEYSLSSRDIRRLQFYVSDGILLEQEVTNIGKNVEDSTYSLKTTEDTYIKRIVFKKTTPCVVSAVEADRLSVSFETADRISFIYDRSHPRGDVFSFKPDKRPGRNEEDLQPARAGFSGWQYAGRETYADSTYNVFLRRDAPYLIVDEESLRNLIIESRSVEGMRQSDLRKIEE